MSTLKNQESTPETEVTHLRRLAANKDIRYSTLENELHKRNNDLLAIKEQLNEAFCKLRDEADRVVKLECDLNKRTEDLRAERLSRQNLEASLASACEKLTHVEQSSKHLQMDLDDHTSRLASQHEMELKRVQQEKSSLEARVRALEAQSLANKPPQLLTRLPRPTTISGAASTAAEARIATLECNLSKAERELADASHALSAAQQEAVKASRLQSELINADNARMRAEKVAKAEKADAESVREALKEREEELEYWRTTAGERSMVEGQLEDALKERDEAVKNEEETRRRAALMETRLREMEEKETELVMEREEAFNELHRLQADMCSTPMPDNPIIAELRATITERESALQEARDHVAELQQMCRDTMNACEDAEARARELDRQLQLPPKDNAPPLVIVSPPPSSAASAPFLAQPKPMTTMSPEDEAIVARLLSAIERLRGERDALRRDLHFVNVEHRVADEALRARAEDTERKVHRLKEDVVMSNDCLNKPSASNTEELNSELKDLRLKLERMNVELTSRSTELADNETEMQLMRVHLAEVEGSKERLLALQKKSSRLAISSLVAVQHLQSQLDEANVLRLTFVETHRDMVQSCDTLTRDRDKAIHSHDHMAQAYHQAEARLQEVTQAKEEAFAVQQTLQEELAANKSCLAKVVKEVEDREAQIMEMSTEITGLQVQVSGLQSELSDAREELSAAEERHSAQQLSTLSSADSSAAEALKAQLDVLDQRVLRRTEQIGMLQHDSKRLETNLRVAEDTIGELTAELETLSQERACLVDDCAQARETRDESLRKVEELEVEMETLVKDRQALEDLKHKFQDAQAQIASGTTSIEVMVHIIANSVARSRALGASLSQTTARLTAIEVDADLAETRYSQALVEVKRLSSELESLTLAHSAKADEVDELTSELATANSEIQRVTAAFESIQSEIKSRENDVTSQTQHLETRIDELEGQLVIAQSSEHAVREELEAIQSREESSTRQTQQLTATIEELEGRLATVLASKDTLSQELKEARVKEGLVVDQAHQLEVIEGQLAVAKVSEETLMKELEAARMKEEDIQARLEQVQEASKVALKEVQTLSSDVARLEQTLETERSSHSHAFETAQQDFETARFALDSEVKDVKDKFISLQEEHANVVQGLNMKVQEMQTHLVRAQEGAAARESMELNLRRLRSVHADELFILRSRLDESIGQVDSLRVQLQTATDTIADLESDIDLSIQRYDAAQVEIRGLDHALACARAQVDEHEASLHALHREKGMLQIEHTRLEAELDKVATKYQYVEQQAKRSDHDVIKLKSEVERLRSEAAKFDEAAQAAEINLSFKSNQFEQKMAMMQRELQKQQSHHQCQENLAELNEKNEYLEEMLRMKSVEIEENDDRFIEALKEKKRLTSKVDSLTRKMQNLQAKLAAATTQTPVPSAAVAPLPLSQPKPKVLSPPLVGSPGPSARPQTRIPSSPAIALRARTPELSRKTFITRGATPEPPVPSFPRRLHKTPEPSPIPISHVDSHHAPEFTPSVTRAVPAPSTPLSSGSRKRRAPDDFDSPVPLPAQAIVAPGGNLTPRHLKRPTIESRTGFTPTRPTPALRPAQQQSSPLKRRTTAPLGESTNSPRGNGSIGLGKPTSISKAPMRSWLSRARAPTVGSGDTRSVSALGVRP